MSDETLVEIPDNQQALDEGGSASIDSGEYLPAKKEPGVDQEMADEYGFTPQQAKEMGLYL